MSQDLVETEERPPMQQQGQMTLAQRELSSRAMAGSVEIESSRAIAEAQAAMVLAKRFPRDEMKAFAKMKAACGRPAFCETAFYQYARGGQNVRGPSIRMAEELARNWGNIDYGLRELSQGDGYSEMQAYAWDLETNTRVVQNFTVNHVRDTRGGGKALTDERDKYEITANMGARRLRSRILALLPDDYVEDAVRMAESTLANPPGAPPLPDRIKRMVAVFEHIGVTIDMLARKLGHPIDQTTPSELASLQGTHKAIKDGQTTSDEQFGTAGQVGTEDKGAALAAKAAGGGKKAAEPKKADPPKAAEPETAKEPASAAAPAAETPAEPKAAQEPAQEAQQAASASEPAAQVAEPTQAAQPPQEAAAAESEEDIF